MKTVRFVGIDRFAEVVDLPRPEPQPEDVIRIGGAGVCHSDLHIMQDDLGLAESSRRATRNAGWIDQVGVGVSGFREGDPSLYMVGSGCG